ncbi:MAG TPA: hypothetical protein VE398_02785 [Acidobacteriota bacterium]|nr:hypothetical protein [Acidobacteriota bacterium]
MIYRLNTISLPEFSTTVECAAQASQVSQQFASRSVALVAFLAETLPDDALQLERRVITEKAKGLGYCVESVLEDIGGARTIKRPAARDHFVKHDAERKDVCSRVKRFSADLLRGHVSGGSGGRALAAGNIRCMRGQAKVQDLYAPRGSDHDIGTLEITVDDPGSVGVAESLDDLNSNIYGGIDFDRSPLDPLGQRLPLDILHNDERTMVILAYFMDYRNVGAVEGGSRTSFVQEVATCKSIS